MESLYTHDFSKMIMHASCTEDLRKLNKTIYGTLYKMGSGLRTKPDIYYRGSIYPFFEGSLLLLQCGVDVAKMVPWSWLETGGWLL
jgi:hypothetical protein